MKPARCYCMDWELDDATPGQLAMRPSSQTVFRSLSGSVLLMLLAGLMVLAFGFPPGCRAVSGERAKLQQLETQHAAAERQARRSASGVTAHEAGSVGRQVAEQDRAAADRLAQEVARQETRVSTIRATLGPLGDTLYWSAMGTLTLLAVIVPFITRRERITLALEPNGHTLRLRRRGQLLRSRRFDLRRYAGLAVVVRRIVVRTSGEFGTTIDHGWQWSVLLVSARPGERWLELIVDEDTFLPQPFTKLTSRVRRVLRVMENFTGLPAAPPVKIDVGETWDRVFTNRLVTRVEHAEEPASSEAPYKPLS